MALSRLWGYQTSLNREVKSPTAFVICARRLAKTSCWNPA
jgi:hypothetical protein